MLFINAIHAYLWKKLQNYESKVCLNVNDMPRKWLFESSNAIIIYYICNFYVNKGLINSMLFWRVNSQVNLWRVWNFFLALSSFQANVPAIASIPDSRVSLTCLPSTLQIGFPGGLLELPTLTSSKRGANYHRIMLRFRAVRANKQKRDANVES